MKVLWFSNCILSKEASKGSGSWLFAMRDLIANEVSLVNITKGEVSGIEQSDGNGIKEYIIPNWKLKNGLPQTDNVQKLDDIVKYENPDIIHIWGIEEYWALLFSRGFIKHDKVLLEMQGVAAGCADVYFGGLTPQEIKRFPSLKSVLFPRYRIGNQYKKSLISVQLEGEKVPYFNAVSVQSKWTRDQLSTICGKDTIYYESLRPIRKEFVKAKKWEQPNNERPVLFSSFSYYEPYKGAHILIKALAALKKCYPNVQLRIAGPEFYGQAFYRGSDYERFLSNMINEYGLIGNIHFCGRLNATQMVEELHHTNIMVNPSFVESYSAAAAESLYIGVPTVLSYAGAMVNFSDLKPVALYYSPMDYRSLAARVITMIENREVRDSLTASAIEVLAQNCDDSRVRERQLETYNKLLNVR